MPYAKGAPFLTQFVDSSGNPIENGSIEFFLWGTSTPTNVYSDASGTSAGTSVTLDSRGAPQNSGTPIDLYFDVSVVYKIVVKDSAGSPIAPTIGPYYGTGVGGNGVALAIDAVDSAASNSLYDYTGTSNGQQVQVGGYYTVGDGGGGVFYWDSSSSDTDDGGMVILPTGHATTGRWKRVYSGSELDVRWWGAKADGTTDNTSAVQAATNYAAASETNAACVFFPQLASPFVVGSITGKKRVVWRGSRGGNGDNTDLDVPTIKYKNATGNLVAMTPSGEDTMMGMSFIGLAIDGNGTTGEIFYLKSFRNLFQDCMIHNASTLIRVGDTVGWAGETRINQCTLQDFDTGVWFSGTQSQDGKVWNNVFVSGAQDGGGLGTYAVRADNGGIQCQNNHMYGGGDYYIYTANSGCVIQNNLLAPVVSGMTAIYMEVASSTRPALICNNRIDISEYGAAGSTSAVGIDVVTESNSMDIEITGNSIYGYTGSTGCVGIRTSMAVGGTKHFQGSVEGNLVHGAVDTRYDLDPDGYTRVLLNDTAARLDMGASKIRLDYLDTDTDILLTDTIPEGVEIANPGSIAIANSSAREGNNVFYKYTGTGNTGWVPVQQFYAADKINLSNISSAVNATWKYKTQLILTSDTDEVFCAKGGAAADVWLNLSGGADVTPA